MEKTDWKRMQGIFWDGEIFNILFGRVTIQVHKIFKTHWTEWTEHLRFLIFIVC